MHFYQKFLRNRYNKVLSSKPTNQTACVGITSVLNVAVSGYELTAVCSRAHAAIQITLRTIATFNY